MALERAHRGDCVVTLSVEDRALRRETCPACGDDYACVTGYVVRDGTPAGVYYAALHGHEDEHEPPAVRWAGMKSLTEYLTFNIPAGWRS